MRGLLFLERPPEEEVTQRTRSQSGGLSEGEERKALIRRSAFPGKTSSGEGEDQEVAFAGDDDGDGVAVGGDGKLAEGEAVKYGNRRGL